MMRSPVRQRGVALITALLIVAMATAISATLSTRLQLDIRRTGNIIASEQAILWMQAAEDWTRRILRQDREDNQHDDLSEDWAIELPPIPIEGGTISGHLTDLQSCFNINSLVNNDAVNVAAQTRFNTLINTLGITPGGNLSQAIIDWLDSNLQTTIPDGAEDGYYLNLEKPYRAANTAMHSLSELRLIKGFEDPQIYQQLSPMLCAFDVAADINVNTAPAEVLRSIANGLSASDVENIITEREENPFEDMNQFLTFNNLRATITDPQGLSVSSQYFLLEAVAVIGQSRNIMYSIIRRNDAGETEVLTRSYGAY